MPTEFPFPCILLSGMPCTGKDTVSRQLVKQAPVFAFFRKHRADPSSPSLSTESSYIAVFPDVFQDIAESGGFIQFHERYGKRYGVSKEEYGALTNAQKIPIIHVGKYENLRRLREGGLRGGLSVLIWSDRVVIHERLIERHKQRPDGVKDRLVAYDQEVEQLKRYAKQETLDFDLVFVNNGSNPEAATNELLSLLRSYSTEEKQRAQGTLVQLLCP